MMSEAPDPDQAPAPITQVDVAPHADGDVVGDTNPNRMFWVAIGASAGGLEALREFVSQIPEHSDQKIVYVVAQHLSPTHKSMLVELLGRETKVPVRDVEDNLRPEPNVIYVTPPNSDVFVHEGMLFTRRPLSEHSPKPSVDYFLTSLAQDQGDHAIAVILSGTGSDGSHGIRAIRAHGGITISQDPKTAKYDGMPSNAIDTGCIDLVLQPDKMTANIAKFIESPRSLQLLQDDHNRTDIQELLFLLKQSSGVDFKDYKTGTLYRRINRRMAACGTVDLADYLKFIQDHPNELKELYADILISVTRFFRDTDAFESFGKEVKRIVESKNHGDPIRIWVPGCATGEEAYSIVILFAEAVGGLAKLRDYHFQLFATDLSVDILTMARRGLYAEATLENVEPKIREEYFRQREGGYEIVKGVRESVVFSRHNVIEDPPFLRLDLITCRNLLIYFNPTLQHSVLSAFHYAMQPAGILFLGKSESLGNSAGLFQPTDNKAKIYRRKLVSGSEHQVFRSKTGGGAGGSVTRLHTPNITSKNASVHELPDALIAAIAPNSLLVDDAMDVMRIYGDVQGYTQLAPGSASMNLMSITRREFRQELRALIYKVAREKGEPAVLRKRLQMQHAEVVVDIHIRPLELKTQQEGLLLVSFEEVKVSEPRETTPTTGVSSDNILFIEMEQELASTREHLQTVVEELETSNEELQSTNEELQSSNEELQSSNEELETANEELQSTNEELLTVNDELQSKSHELTDTNENLNNVKESFDFPLVVVDQKLQLKLYNDAAKQLFQLEDTGGPVSVSLLGSHVDLPELRGRIIEVMESGEPQTRQIDGDNACYAERILPYRNDRQKIVGTVLTYVDNTVARKIETRLQTSEERFQLAVDGSSVGLWDWQIEKDELYCSQRLLDILQVNDTETARGMDFFRRRLHDDDRTNVLDILDAHLSKGFEFNVECRLRRGDDSRTLDKTKDKYIWVHLRGQAIWDGSRNPVRMSGSLDDYTEKHTMIEALRNSNQALGRFAYVCSHDLSEPARLASNFADLLKQTSGDELTEDQAEYVDHIAQNTSRMQMMIRDMLTYAQLENKGALLADVDCNGEVEKAKQHLQLAIEESGAVVTCGDLPIVRADRTQLFQLFLNLLGNAIKFRGTAKPKVIIKVTELPNFWEFSVADNGIGMDPDYTGKIFNEFQRLNANDDYPGTGIGLSICQKVVSMHGGKIWVESDVGKGSTFRFHISKNVRLRTR